MTERFRIEDNKIIDIYMDCELNTDVICSKLNNFEESRLRKNMEIKKFKNREEKFQRFISGVMAFLQLYMNSELWSDLDE